MSTGMTIEPSLAVHCELGLGNRVAAMANGISRHDSIVFHWVANNHCPAPSKDIFPDGIDGVELIDTEAVQRPPGIDEQRGCCTRWGGISCFKWEAAGDRERANEAYGAIIASMAGSALPGAPTVAICGRFWINPEADPVELAEWAAEAAHKAEDSRVFILADRYRAEIAGRLSALGVVPVMATAGEMEADLERDSAGVVAYLNDWKTLIDAESVFYTKPRISSAIFPIRARFGHD
jgi:hypothetical protein